MEIKSSLSPCPFPKEMGVFLVKFRWIINYSSFWHKWISWRGAFLPLWGRLGWGFLFFLSSCVEKVDWTTQTVSNTNIVVDGIITNELKRHSVTLSLPTAELNQTPQAISGANVTINNGDTTFALIETPTGSGIYLTDSIQAIENKTYTLSILYNGKTYTAQTYLTSVSSLAPISYGFNTNDSLFYYDWKMDVYFAEDAMYEFYFDWSKVVGYENLDAAQNHFLGYTYTLKTIDVNEIFAAQKENANFPAGTIITEKKYSLTPEHADYIRAMLSETQWNGNVFEASPANLPTNLSDGAIGFFAGCEVVVDTLVVSY